MLMGEAVVVAESAIDSSIKYIGANPQRQPQVDRPSRPAGPVEQVAIQGHIAQRAKVAWSPHASRARSLDFTVNLRRPSAILRFIPRRTTSHTAARCKESPASAGATDKGAGTCSMYSM